MIRRRWLSWLASVGLSLLLLQGAAALPALADESSGVVLTASGPSVLTQEETALFTVRLQSDVAYPSVLALFEIDGTADTGAVSIEYQEGDTWLPLPVSAGDGKLLGYFGPPAGFPVGADYDVTSPFKVTFHQPGAFTAAFAVVTVAESPIILDTDSLGVQVVAPGTLSMRAGGPGKTVVDHETAVTVSLANLSSTDLAAVLVRFTVDGATAPSDLTIQYKEGSEWVNLPIWLEEDFTVAGMFGPESGFPVPALYEKTTLFKVTYHKEGTFRAVFRAVSVGEGETVLAQAGKTVEVALEQGKGNGPDKEEKAPREPRADKPAKEAKEPPGQAKKR